MPLRKVNLGDQMQVAIRDKHFVEQHMIELEMQIKLLQKQRRELSKRRKQLVQRIGELATKNE
jgi:hypothetical protein